MLSAIDTNIAIYAYLDVSDAGKTKIASNLMIQSATLGECVISTQVLKEFASVATSGRRRPLLPQEAITEYLELLMRMELVHVDEALILAGVARHFRSKISFYDALIVEAALKGGAEILYSEDLQHGQRFDSLQVINPFL